MKSRGGEEQEEETRGASMSATGQSESVLAGSQVCNVLLRRHDKCENHMYDKCGDHMTSVMTTSDKCEDYMTSVCR